MPISLDSVFQNPSTGNPPAAAKPSGMPVDELFKDVKAKPAKPVGDSILTRVGRGLSTGPITNWWQEFTKESNASVAGLRSDVQHLPDIKPGDYKDLGETIGKGLIDLVGAVFSPISSAAETGVVRPVEKHVLQPAYNLTGTEKWEQDLLNDDFDNLVQFAVGAVTGGGGETRAITSDFANLSARDKELLARVPKPKYRVVGTAKNGKPIMRRVMPGGAAESPHPQTLSEAALATGTAFDALAMKDQSTAEKLASQVEKTHPQLGKAMKVRAKAKAKAPLEEQVATGVKQARQAATDWDRPPGDFQYLDSLHARMAPDYAIHTSNFERSGVTQSSHKLLDTMIARARSTSNDYTVRILEKLRSVVPDLPVSFKRMLQDENGTDAPRVSGWYIYGPKGDSIEIRHGASATKSLIHELVHAATTRFMESNPAHPAVKELTRLYHTAWDRFKSMSDSARQDLDMPYGLTNEKEFVSEALSNPKFQDWMIYSEGFRSPGEKLRNMWSSFVTSLHKIFGVSSPEEARLFHNTVRLSNHIMDLQAAGSLHLAADEAGKAATQAFRLGDRGDAFESLIKWAPEKLGLGVVTGKIKEYWRFIQDNIAPETLGIEARKAGATVAEAIARRVKLDVQTTLRGKARRDYWAANPRLAQSFINGFEQGHEFTDPTLAKAAQAYRNWAEDIRSQDSEIGIDYDPVDHYFPHIFENPDDVREWMSQRFGTKWTRPNFTKDREFDLIKQAVAAGKKLRYTNPEDIMQARAQASNQARMKVEVLEELERQGLAVRREPGDEVPNWLAAKYPSPAGGGFYVHRSAARIVHNAFDSRSMWTMHNPIGDLYRGFMWMKNKLVPVKLAISLFHPLHVLTIHNAAGMVRASKELFSGTMGPVEWAGKIAKESTLLWSNIEDSKVGGRLMQAYRGKISEANLTDQDRQALQYLTEGGMQPEMSALYRGNSLQKFHDALVAHSAKAIWHAPYAAIEALQGVVFQHWIPNLKVASYLKDVQAALRTQPELIDNADARRLVLRRLAKSVDNRYGEMAYNTLFWNRWVKDLAVANTLSLGWQLGFLREFGGGALDVGQAIMRPNGIAQAVREGQLDRSMFSTYYLTNALGYGGLLTWAMTGKPPSSLIDYIYPQTGEVGSDGKPERASTMFYTREIASIVKHYQQEGALDALGDIVESKATGSIGLISEWARGVNDFGQQIRNPDDPLYKQVEQTLAATLKDAEPISVSRTQGKSLKDFALSMSGFSQAPKYATRSAGEAKIEDTYQKFYRPAETPYDRAQYSDETKSLRKLYSDGKFDQFDDQIEALQDKYHLTGAQVKRLVRQIASGKSSEATMFQHFTWEQQKSILEKMSPAERERYIPLTNREHREEFEEEFSDAGP